jgi:ribonuclease J
VLVGEDEATLGDRRRLSFSGVVSVSVVLTDKGALAADPMIDLTGLPAFDREGEEMSDVVADAVAETIETLPKARRRDPEAVAESLKRAVRSACQQAWGKKPMCHVLVTVL